jgi:hypothetical protein
MSARNWCSRARVACLKEPEHSLRGKVLHCSSRTIVGNPEVCTKRCGGNSLISSIIESISFEHLHRRGVATGRECCRINLPRKFK